MPDTTIPRVPLGAPTTNRKWQIDVAEQNGSYVGLFGITEQKVKRAVATTQDDSDMDGGGHKSQATTALAWGVEGKANRKTVNGQPGSYDPGQEIVRNAAKRLGNGNVIRVRIYEMEDGGPRVEAFEGLCSVTFDDDGGGMDALSSFSFTLNGRGRPVDIAHPAIGATVPILSGASPSGAAAGTTILLTGSGFTDLSGATQVKVGTANATSYRVLNDGQILAVVPAGSAGQTTITVGTSTIPYTRGA